MTELSEAGMARRILQPGPVHPDRIESFTAPLVAGEITLEANEVLMEGVSSRLEEVGLRSAALDLAGAALQPMQFVMPTYSQDAEHVAFYSDTHHREGVVRVTDGTATYGTKDGEPFLHGHLLWQEGEMSCGGHVLPGLTKVAEPCTIRYAGAREIGMDARFDQETNFTLFGPNVDGDPNGDFVVARIRCNEDLVGAIEQVCRRHQISRARVLSLIGSTVGARFENGPVIDAVPTEILGLNGDIQCPQQGSANIDLTIALIDADGDIHRGRPLPGENPVLICAELFLQRLES